jgi:hypothetical protein
LLGWNNQCDSIALTFHENDSRGISQQNFKKTIEEKYKIKTKRTNAAVVFIGLKINKIDMNIDDI